MELGFNVAFVTSQTYRAYQLPRPGEAANQECTRLAAEAGLHGTRYVAWLAAEGPTTNVADDVQPADFLQRRGGWVRPDGQPVAISRASLLRGELLHPIALDPQRTLIRQRDAWAGTTAAGLLWRDPDGKAYDCDDWSDEYGLGGTAYPDSLWIGDTAASGCEAIRRLLCFGDDSDAEVPVPASVGRLAFITASEFALGGGIAGANALCQLEACQAGLTGGTSCTTDPGTARVFRAYLHTSGQPAWTRFDLDGPTWVRPDGVPWLSDAASLALDGEGRPTLLNQTANGSYLGLFKSWTGDVERTQTCQDWTSTSQTEQGGAAVQSILTGISSGAAAPCLLGLDYRLTCLER